MSRYGARWSRAETILAFGLYCELPFGKLHSGNPSIIQLADALGRTPSSVAMKACNFASLDPALQSRGVKGLGNVSIADQAIWNEFFADSAAVVDEIEQERASRMLEEVELPFPSGPTGGDERLSVVRVRRHQRFFRASVLSIYSGRCALTGLRMPELLVASHIIPWSKSQNRRCDPTNGLCLNALHDRAFDRGLITFDDNLQLVLSSKLIDEDDLGLLADCLRLDGRRLVAPERFLPDREAMAFHREQIFVR